MNKTNRVAAVIGVVCGAELIAAVVIGGAGIAAFASVEAAIVAASLGAVILLAVLNRQRKIQPAQTR